MKKLILSSALILTFINTNAQDIIDISAKEICSCANERIRTVDFAGSSQKESFLFICTTNVFNQNVKSILKEYGQDELLVGTLDRFTKDVNEKLVNICPNILPETVQESVNPSIVNDKLVTDIVPVQGTVLNITTNQYPTIEIKDKSGNLHSFVIVESFPTDSLFTMGGIKLGSLIVVTYEMYEMKEATLKKITKLEKIK